MKASRLLEILQEAISLHGDADVVFEADHDDGGASLHDIDRVCAPGRTGITGGRPSVDYIIS